MRRAPGIGIVSEQPHRAAKQVGIAQVGPAALFACHRMAGQECRALRSVVEPRRSLHDQPLGTAHVGDQMLGPQHARELFHEVDSGVDGHRDERDLRLLRGLNGVGGNRVNRA
jgi:hypothetical protein